MQGVMNMEQSTEGTILQITLHPEIEKLLSKKKPNNCKTGERQTVYPIKTHKDIIAMANWLYEHKNNKYVLAFTLGINLGLRANELLDLKMNQVFSPDGSVRLIEDEEDTSDGIDIYQSKTKKHRTVFLNAACKDALEWAFQIKGAYLHSEEYLFPSREGGAIQVGTFRKVLKEAAAACGLKQNIGTHTCRKTWGWHQYKYNSEKANLDITMLQRAFGHSSPEVTLRYLGITDEEDKALYKNMCINVVSDHDFVG
jgi:integrase